MQLLGISVTVQEALFSSIKEWTLSNRYHAWKRNLYTNAGKTACRIYMQYMYQIYMAFSIVNDILLYNYHLRGILSDIWTQRLWSKLLHDFNTRSILHSVTIVFHKFLPDYFLFWKH